MKAIIPVERGRRLIPESERVQTVYSGTLVENYRKCTSAGRSGLVFYDKSKEPAHVFQEGTFYVRDLSGAIDHAIRIAAFLKEMKNLDVIPLVMAGTVPWGRYSETSQGKIPAPVLFPVEKVWIPKEGTYIWNQIVDLKTGKLHSKPQFVEADPRSLIDLT